MKKLILAFLMSSTIAHAGIDVCTISNLDANYDQIACTETETVEEVMLQLNQIIRIQNSTHIRKEPLAHSVVIKILVERGYVQNGCGNFIRKAELPTPGEINGTPDSKDY